jgi:hypothetical protein
VYHLVGSEDILRDAVILSVPHAPDGKVGSRTTLRAAYLRMLAGLAESPAYEAHVRDRAGESGPMLTGTRPAISALAEMFADPVDMSTTVQDASAERLARCRRGWAYLSERDSRLADAVSLLVHTMFTRASTWTGSMSDRHAIGAMLLLPGDNWDDNDVAEAIIHEFTHTALFLDERVNGHFRAGTDEITLHSAIRHDERTLPAVVHSLLVAVEILTWRARHCTDREHAFKLHGPNDALMAKTLGSLNSLRSVASWDDVVKPRMRSLVDAADSELSRSLAAAGRS